MSVKAVLPRDPEDVLRWEQTALRRDMLDGHWRNHLERHQAAHLDPTKLAAWGPPALGVCLYRSFISQLTVAQRDDPTVTNTEKLTPEQEAYMQSLPLWMRHLALATYVAGLSECLVRVHWLPGNQAAPAGIDIRIVTPDRVVVKCLPSAPGVPVRIEEAVERFNPKSQAKEWTWDVWSVEDPKAPFFRIESNTARRLDLTAIYAPEMVGRYDWVEDARPYLPWVLYHAIDTGKTWNWWHWAELVMATLDVGLLLSFWMHIVRDASWAQKIGINVRLRGMKGGEKGKNTSHRISTDVASVLLFETDPGNPGDVKVLEPSSDPKKIMESIRDFLAVIALNLGLSAADVEKTQAESGVAIQLRYDAIRRLQKVYLPGLRRGDVSVVELVAKVSNAFGVGVPKLPETGWQITYPSLPLTKEEQTERLDIRERELGLGLISKVDMYIERHPELTRDEAIEKLQAIEQETRMLGGAPAPRKPAPFP